MNCKFDLLLDETLNKKYVLIKLKNNKFIIAFNISRIGKRKKKKFYFDKFILHYTILNLIIFYMVDYLDISYSKPNQNIEIEEIKI